MDSNGRGEGERICIVISTLGCPRRMKGLTISQLAMKIE